MDYPQSSLSLARVALLVWLAVFCVWQEARADIIKGGTRDTHYGHRNTKSLGNSGQHERNSQELGEFSRDSEKEAHKEEDNPEEATGIQGIWNLLSRNGIETAERHARDATTMHDSEEAERVKVHPGLEGKVSGSQDDTQGKDSEDLAGDSKKDSDVQLVSDGDMDAIPMIIGGNKKKKKTRGEEEEGESQNGREESSKHDPSEGSSADPRKLFGGEKREGGKEAAAVDDNPDHYDAEAKGEREGEGKEGATGEGTKAEGGKKKEDQMGEMMERILDRLDDIEDKGGKYNETVEKQDAVVETVVRVGGGKHHEEDEAEAEKQQEEGEKENDEKQEGGAGKEGSKEEAGRNQFDGMKALDAVDQQLQQEKEKEEGQGQSLLGMLFGKEQKEKPHVEEQKPNATLVADAGGVKKGGKSGGLTKRGGGKVGERKGSKGDDDKEDVARLIDSQDNEYVISNPGKGSKMTLQEDFTLISDIVKVIVTAAFGGLVCGLLGQPPILGYLVAGMVIGPGGLGLIHELVQVETLAQFGVVFLLFALGVEFNVAKMQGVHGVALGGGAIQILTAMTLGGIFANSPTQGIFVGAFLSMSSTTVVLKCLMDANMMHTENGQIMLGTLILQDCALGLLLAVMPALAARSSSPLSIATVLSKEVIILLAFCGLAWLLAKVFIPRFLLVLTRLSKYNSELYQLGIVANCLCVALLSEYLGLSLEVGAFVAGLMLSGDQSEKTLHQVEPIRNIFAALFLASIGMVMHPLFLWQHKDILVAALVVVFFGKALLIAVVVRAFGYKSSTAASVGIALAQIGEFSFVLLSRAQTLNLVGHKLYLLLMGTTALSLVLTPFAFKIVPRLISPQDRARAHVRIGGVGSKGSLPPSPPILPVTSSPVVSPFVISSSSHRDGVDAIRRPRAGKSTHGVGGGDEDFFFEPEEDKKGGGSGSMTPRAAAAAVFSGPRGGAGPSPRKQSSSPSGYSALFGNSSLISDIIAEGGPEEREELLGGGGQQHLLGSPTRRRNAGVASRRKEEQGHVM